MSVLEKSLSVLIVDDHRLVAEGISSLLQDSQFERDIGCGVDVDIVQSVQQAKDFITRGLPYGLILLDLSLQSQNGFDLLSSLQARQQQLNVIVLSASDNTPDMQRAFDLGAKGYICKFEPSEEMLRRIGLVIKGAQGYPDTFSEGVKAKGPSECVSLTGRQQDVLELIANGESNKQISGILHVSEATVKFHVSELFRQLGVRNRTMCVREAVRLGLISYDTDS